MAATKPQIRSLFATPVAIHFLPVAQEVNAELRPLILEKAQASTNGEGWNSGADFEKWGAEPAQTVFRVARDLADNMTSTRTGARVALDWKITAAAAVRQKGDYRAFASQPGAYWSGVYYVDDGYAKSDDETLGGECELADPRGALPIMVAPHLGFRIPGGQTAVVATPSQISALSQIPANTAISIGISAVGTTFPGAALSVFIYS